MGGSVADRTEAQKPCEGIQEVTTVTGAIQKIAVCFQLGGGNGDVFGDSVPFEAAFLSPRRRGPSARQYMGCHQTVTHPPGMGERSAGEGGFRDEGREVSSLSKRMNARPERDVRAGRRGGWVDAGTQSRCSVREGPKRSNFWPPITFNQELQGVVPGPLGKRKRDRKKLAVPGRL